MAARLLGTDNFGVFVVLVTAASAVSEIAIFGVNRLSLRDVAASLARDDRSELSVIMSRVRAISRTSVPAVSVAAGLVAYSITDDRPWLLGSAVAVLIAASAHQKLWADLLRGAGYIRWASLLEGRQGGALATVAQFALLLTVGLVTRVDLALAVVLAAIGVVLPVLAIRRPQRALSACQGRAGLLPTLRAAIARGWPFMGTAITSQFHANADLWIAGLLLSPQLNSEFAAAQRIVLLVAIPLASFQIAFAPVIARLHAASNMEDLQSLLRSTATVATGVALLGLLPMVLVPGPVLRLAFGPEFVPAGAILLILALGQVSNVVTGLCGIALSMARYEHAVFRISAATAVLRVGAGVVAASLFGARGLALSSAFVTAVLFGILWWFARYRLGIRTDPTLRPKLRMVLRAAA